jgi:hypothetical protein
MGDHVEGMAVLRNVAIDQHLLRRNRQFDLIEIVQAHPELLGVGIDENTAIVVRGDRRGDGAGYVAIYDHEGRSMGRAFTFIRDRFDLKTRLAERRSPPGSRSSGSSAAPGRSAAVGPPYAAARRARHYVYVIKLDDAVLNEQSSGRPIPAPPAEAVRACGLPHVPEKRFAQHRRLKANRYVE